MLWFFKTASITGIIKNKENNKCWIQLDEIEKKYEKTRLIVICGLLYYIDGKSDNERWKVDCKIG